MHRFWSIAGLVAATGIVLGITTYGVYSQTNQNTLREVNRLSNIENEAARAAAPTLRAFKVIYHPRFRNFHPRDDSHRQGDTHAMLKPHVARGPNDFRPPEMQCTNCDGPDNVADMTGNVAVATPDTQRNFGKLSRVRGFQRGGH